MNKTKLLLLFAAVLVCAGSACPKKIKTTSFIVRHTNASTVGISDGGKVQWFSPDDGKPFVVHIYPSDSSPCEGGKNDLQGYPDHPAVCVIGDDMDGLFRYSILRPGDDQRAVQAKEFPFHVDVCSPKCNARKGKNGPPKRRHVADVTRTINPQVVAIDCENGKDAIADPPTFDVYAKQVIVWSQLGPDSARSWQTSNLGAICEEGDKFGIIDQDGHVECTVKNDAPTGPHPYDVTYGIGKTRPLDKSCSGHASLTVVDPPKSN